MKTMTKKIHILCALFAVFLTLAALTLTADAHAFNSRDLGCDRMSTIGFVFAHLISIFPFMGIFIALANDCGWGGWAYWLFLAPTAGIMLYWLLLPLFTLVIGIIGSIGDGGRSARSPFIVGVFAFTLALSMTSTVQAGEWDADISRMQKDIVAAVSPYGESANANFFVSFVIADAGMSICWGAAQIVPYRKISINAIDVVRTFYEDAARGKIDRNSSLAIMRNCVREIITALESQNIPPHKIRALVFGKIDNSISAWRTKKFWFDAGLRISDMAKAK